MKGFPSVDLKGSDADKWENVGKTRQLPFRAVVRLGVAKPLKKKKLIGKIGRIFGWHKKGKSFKVQLKKKSKKEDKFNERDFTSFTIVPIGSLEWNGLVGDSEPFNWRENDPAKDTELYTTSAQKLYFQEDPADLKEAKEQEKQQKQEQEQEQAEPGGAW
jgi:hypothetical protein